MNLVGKSFNERYYVISKIGEGGMAEVYLADDVEMKRSAAVKIIKDSTSMDPLNVARFQREAKASSKLEHKNIVSIYDIGEFMGKPYMIMEYVKGQTLKDVLKKRGSFSLAEASDIIIQLADALSCAHNNGIIHRDVKPQNVMIRTDGTVKLTDFGIALVSDAPHLTQKNIVVGSVHYMAPEVAEGKGASVQSDIYSLGITFFELLTGRLPYADTNAVNVALKQISEPLPSVRRYRNDVNKRIEKLIFKACSKNPRDRYATMDEFKEDLKLILSGKKKETFFSRLFKRGSKDA